MLRVCGGKFRRQRLSAPKGLSTRPTAGMLRETVFNICQHSIEGASFLDLFAGSGAMGIEALSRGAQRAVFVDQDRRAAQCIRENLQQLKIEDQAQVLMLDAKKALKNCAEKKLLFDFIYIDPPYGVMDKDLLYAKRLLLLIDEWGLLNSAGTVFCEEASGAELEHLVLKDLHFVKVRNAGRSQLWQWETKKKLLNS